MSQLEKKFLEDDSADGSKVRFLNGQPFRVNKADGTVKELFKVNGSDQFEVLSQPVASDGLPQPSAPKHYVTVEYINNFVQGKTDAKDSTNVYSPSNVPLAGVAPLMIDGVTLAPGPAGRPTRVGLGGQTSAAANGIYDYTESGGNYALTRSSDFNEDTEVSKGAYYKVVNGTNYAGYEVLLTTDDPIILGTTALTFVAYPSTERLEAGDMLARVGNVFYVDLAPLSGLESTNPGQPNGQLRVKTDTAALEKDKTTRIDPSTGATVAKKSRKFSKTLTSTDVTNGYVDFSFIASQDSLTFGVQGAPDQFEGEDYSVNYTGGTGGNTRITFLNGLAVGGVSALVAGDKVFATATSF